MLRMMIQIAAALALAEPAPVVPQAHAPLIAAAAQRYDIDPSLLAATAAWESEFKPGILFRAEPHLPKVLWRARRAAAPQWMDDGSIGPCQVLRSNLVALGVDNDEDGASPEVNYRAAARIIRGHLESFKGSLWHAVTAYNIGAGGVRRGGDAPGRYTETILAWSDAYRAARVWAGRDPLARALSAPAPQLLAARASGPMVRAGRESEAERHAHGFRRRRRDDEADFDFLADLPY